MANNKKKKLHKRRKAPQNLIRACKKSGFKGLKRLRVLFGAAARNTRHVIAVGFVTSLFIAHGTITSQAANNPPLERALASAAKVIVVSEISDRYGDFAGNAVGEAVDEFHRATSPDRCTEDAFRGERTEAACRKDQMEYRVNGYIGVVAVNLANRAFSNTTSGPRKP